MQINICGSVKSFSPETMRASFGPTVWMFPIVAVATLRHNHQLGHDCGRSSSLVHAHRRATQLLTSSRRRCPKNFFYLTAEFYFSFGRNVVRLSAAGWAAERPKKNFPCCCCCPLKLELLQQFPSSPFPLLLLSPFWSESFWLLSNISIMPATPTGPTDTLCIQILDIQVLKKPFGLIQERFFALKTRQLICWQFFERKVR